VNVNKDKMVIFFHGGGKNVSFFLAFGECRVTYLSLQDGQ
jgi:hypothetical protein